MHIRILVFFLLFLVARPSISGVSFSQTRIVYEDGKLPTITAINSGGQIYLLQAGVITTPDSKGATPFKVIPTISRLEGDSKSILRIHGDRVGLSSLPKDRESVFYFFGTAIAAKPKDVEEGQVTSLSIGLRTVLKLFYRPMGIVGGPAEVFGALQAERVGTDLIIRNSTAYHATFSTLIIDDKEMDFEYHPSMIAPYSEVRYKIGTKMNSVRWRLISDFGGETAEKKVIL
ncbi:TPA: molecular chaperone [Aeromonas sobria]|nr:molecular chaperone [Aeromonas sobria]